jgi:hypothetical protein
MKGEVKQLGVVSVADERKQQTIQLLEQYLEDARAGKYDEVLIVANLAHSEVFEWGWTRARTSSASSAGSSD